jgi:hypothetical protein
MKTATKKITLGALGLVMLYGTGVAQNEKKRPVRDCGTEQHEAYLNSLDPKREQKIKDYRLKVEYFKDHPELRVNQSTQAVITIPVVVHVVYQTAAQNISTAQVTSQITVLNEDFGRTNADTVNTPTAFKSVAANTNIQFCLAQRDPSGNPTNGIDRVSTTTASWTTDDKVKSASTGGADAWDPTRYLNIWVCNLGSGLLGYGEFPTGTVSQTFGVVILSSAFGNTGSVTTPYDLGRTTTHEFSHCFNLFHIWGDDGTACTGSDNCADTPNQAGATTTCPAFPLTDACSPSSPGVQFMNYMDYSYDNCMNMFTLCQSTTMNAVLNVVPYNALKTSMGCMAVTLPPLDAGITTINNPSGLSCVTTVTPNVTIKNWGTNTLTSADIKYKIDGGALQTFAWSGSLASLATATVALPSMTTTVASHTFTANSANPNGGVDGNATNDASTGTFTVTGGTGAALPYIESFESAFPPAGITINNPDAATTWAQATWAAKTGTKSAYMDYFNYTATKQKDEIVLPALNLTGGTNQQLTFQVAYQLYTSPTASVTYSDTLEVFISTNCGTTWTQLYKKFSTPLTTTTPAFSTTSFTPTASQWRQETISLVPYASSTNAMIKFVAINGYENQLYVDDINISSTTGIQQANENNGINIYPNPTNGTFSIDIQHNASEVNSISVVNSLGQMVYQTNKPNTSGNYSVDLSGYSNGIYFVQVIKSGIVYQKKIVVNK